jgi:RNA-directed DNA polymerase
MKESHRKGPASHPDPESCGGRRKAPVEAVTGAQAGRVLSCEISYSRVPTTSDSSEGTTA